MKKGKIKLEDYVPKRKGGGNLVAVVGSEKPISIFDEEEIQRKGLRT